LKFPLYKQLDAMDCGPTCLRMVAKYYGRSIPLDYLRDKHGCIIGNKLLGFKK
jgi:ATP-binding cassette, subfamily B, bacterial